MGPTPTRANSEEQPLYHHAQGACRMWLGTVELRCAGRASVVSSLLGQACRAALASVHLICADRLEAVYRVSYAVYRMPNAVCGVCMSRKGDHHLPSGVGRGMLINLGLRTPPDGCSNDARRRRRPP